MTFTVQDATTSAGTLYIDDCFLGVSGGSNVLSNLGFEIGIVTWSLGAPFTNLQPGGGSAPAAPTGLTATPANAQIALSRSPSTGATSYYVKRSFVNGSGYATVN